MTNTNTTPEASAGTRSPAPVANRPRGRWWALVVISLAQLMAIMDTTVVIVALPSAQRSLGISDAMRQWVVTAYTLAYGGLLLLGGRLADRFGQRRTLLVAMIGFATASAISGSAINGGMLIVSRALQGAFGALLVPSATSFVALLFPVSEPRAGEGDRHLQRHRHRGGRVRLHPRWHPDRLPELALVPVCERPAGGDCGARDTRGALRSRH